MRGSRPSHDGPVMPRREEMSTACPELHLLCYGRCKDVSADVALIEPLLWPVLSRLRTGPVMLNIPKSQTEKSFADGKILQNVSDGIGIVTFNNPGKRNAMSLDMWEGLGQSLIELRDD